MELHNNNIYNLIYISEIHQSDNHLLELNKIGYTSQKNNLKIGITGILIKIDHTFIQLLEGKKKQVILLYEKISLDPRHKNLSILISDFTKKRTCAKWNMAILNLDKKNILAQTEFKSGLEILNKIKSNRSVHFLIKSLIKNKIRFDEYSA